MEFLKSQYSQVWGVCRPWGGGSWVWGSWGCSEDREWNMGGGGNSVRLMIKRCLFLAFQNYFDYVCEENILSS